MQVVQASKRPWFGTVNKAPLTRLGQMAGKAGTPCSLTEIALCFWMGIQVHEVDSLGIPLTRRCGKPEHLRHKLC